MSMTDFSGIYPPIPTPFTDDESLALDQLEANLNKWLELPLAGIVMPGSNSEAVFLHKEERLSIWEVCSSVLKGCGKRFIAGTGVESTAGTIELCQKSSEYGAEAALVLPPFFYKPALTPDVLIMHYRTVANESPIPLLIYNVPVFTGIDFAPATLISLAEHPNIIGVKDSSANVVKIASVLERRPDFQAFAGTGSALLPFLTLGARGGIMALANFAAIPLSQLMEAFKAGQIEEARRLQLSLAEINAAVTTRYGVAGLKYAMDCCGFYGGPPRRPLLPLAQGPRAEINRLLEELELV